MKSLSVSQARETRVFTEREDAVADAKESEDWFADAGSGGGDNYVTTLPTEAAERGALGERVGGVFDPAGDDVAVSRVSGGEQYRSGAGRVLDALGVVDRVTDGDRLFRTVPPDGWFLGAIGGNR